MSTIEDVAKEANVSVATVSRVINNPEIVKEETRLRVYEAIEKLSYEPNISARNLRKNETRVVLIVTPNITNPYYAHILAGIGDMAQTHGYSALIYNTYGKESEQKKALDMLKKKRSDGAIILASNMDSNWIEDYASEYPIVLCSEYPMDVDISRVSIDNYDAAYNVMQYIYSLGHRKIAMISSTNNYISTYLRLKAYQDFLNIETIECNEEYIQYADEVYSFKSGKEATLKLLNLKEKPSAIFCISDTIALGAIAAIKESNLDIPQDICVVGFDDVDYTTMFHPYLTTVSQPCYKLGTESFRLLNNLFKNGIKSIEKRIIPYELIVRETTKSLF
ncbi:LacI family transcriptional regulator [Soehngenia saccharolytica]|nr:LacI family transcriptional regulator [Soehngenia saccharolytica]